MEKAAKFEELIVKVTEDAELRNKCVAAVEAGKADELLKELGCNFTFEEITTYLEEKNEDVSIKELQAVAGGIKDEGKMAFASNEAVGVAVLLIRNVACGMIN